MRKTLSFAVVHVAVAFAVGYLMTGSLAVGGALALVEPVVNTLAYHLHERLWARARPRAVPGSSREGSPPPAAAGCGSAGWALAAGPLPALSR